MDSTTWISVAVVSIPQKAVYKRSLVRKEKKKKKTDPIVGHKARSDDFRASVDGPCCEWNLEEGREFLLLFDGGLGMHKAALVGNRAD